MSAASPTVGIIGGGDFGALLATHLKGHVSVKMWSRKTPVAEEFVSTFEEIAVCDYIILSIPLVAYEPVLGRLKPLIKPSTVIVDVCSVKLKPIETIKAILPNQPLVATHPLFGPQSAAHSVMGHVIVFCPEASDPAAYEKAKTLAAELGLKVVQMSADEHDKQMAQVHGLTFFVARALDRMGVDRISPVGTPYYNRLVDLAKVDASQTDDLFLTTQKGNPYAAEVRQNFVAELEKLEADLEK